MANSIPAFKRLDLTCREADVLLCITRGHSNVEIGANLGISPRTVKKHLEHIYSKLGVKSRLAAAAKVGPHLRYSPGKGEPSAPRALGTRLPKPEISGPVVNNSRIRPMAY